MIVANGCGRDASQQSRFDTETAGTCATAFRLCAVFRLSNYASHHSGPQVIRAFRLCAVFRPASVRAHLPACVASSGPFGSALSFDQEMKDQFAAKFASHPGLSALRCLSTQGSFPQSRPVTESSGPFGSALSFDRKAVTTCKKEHNAVIRAFRLCAVFRPDHLPPCHQPDWSVIRAFRLCAVFRPEGNYRPRLVAAKSSGPFGSALSFDSKSTP